MDLSRPFSSGPSKPIRNGTEISGHWTAPDFPDFPPWKPPARPDHRPIPSGVRRPGSSEKALVQRLLKSKTSLGTFPRDAVFI